MRRPSPRLNTAYSGVSAVTSRSGVPSSLMLAVYDRAFNAALHALQLSYERDARALDAERWRGRPARERLLEGLASLVAPML